MSETADTPPDTDASEAATGDDASSGAGQIDPRLLEILVCPMTKAPLEYDRQRQELVSRSAGLAYPIRDGIPIMLIDEARRIDEDAAARP